MRYLKHLQHSDRISISTNNSMLNIMINNISKENNEILRSNSYYKRLRRSRMRLRRRLMTLIYIPKIYLSLPRVFPIKAWERMCLKIKRIKTKLAADWWHIRRHLEQKLLADKKLRSHMFQELEAWKMMEKVHMHCIRLTTQFHHLLALEWIIRSHQPGVV